jgi:hypothetical protein
MQWRFKKWGLRRYFFLKMHVKFVNFTIETIGKSQKRGEIQVLKTDGQLLFTPNLNHLFEAQIVSD